MTYRQIYGNALRLICEVDSAVDTTDYEERATYILATFLGQCAPIDRQYRVAHQMSKHAFLPVACVDPDHTFDLAEVFVTPAEYYLAAMLVLDENEEMSERFFSLYTDAISTLLSTLPSACEPINDRYKLLI